MMVETTSWDYLLGNACVMKQRWKMRDEGVWERNKHEKTEKQRKDEGCVENWAGHCVMELCLVSVSIASFVFSLKSLCNAFSV